MAEGRAAMKTDIQSCLSSHEDNGDEDEQGMEWDASGLASSVLICNHLASSGTDVGLFVMQIRGAAHLSLSIYFDCVFGIQICH